jgi:phosphate transport system permease protein
MHASDRGAVGLFASGLGTLAVLLLLALLLWIVAVNAFVWFWPAEIYEVKLVDGSSLIGQPFGHDPGSVDRPSQLRLKVGNRETNDRDFIWIDENRIGSIDTPPELVRIVRTRHGDAYGRIVSATAIDGQTVDAGDGESMHALVKAGSAAHRRLDRLRARHDRVRRPLTRVEQRIGRLERSSGAPELATTRELMRLERERSDLEAALMPRLEDLESEMAEMRGWLTRAQLEVEAGGQTVVVRMTQMVEVVWPNDMGFLRKVVYALAKGVEFLSHEPRSANTEGGIYPILFGTILMVLLMSLAVMPLGVVAAVYLDEYARPGLMVRLVRRAIHNLAGVPSIVFGMFGLAFFVYGVGGAIDSTFFAGELPAPTFGTGGILWASLTLAVLTIPVVVVATTEGLQAVPTGWRDGSRALGATRWQTLRSIVLPAATPGMLTGLILAVGRAAGEVAPLMLTGAVKLAHGLPLDTEAPYLHLQRKFMHLGFHIFDVSMQSPDVEAAKPMAFASTLVLLGLVVIINLTAILIRRRLHSVYRVLEE